MRRPCTQGCAPLALGFGIIPLRGMGASPPGLRVHDLATQLLILATHIHELAPKVLDLATLLLYTP